MGKRHKETIHQKAYIDINNNVKRCLTPLAIKEVKIKTMMRYLYPSNLTAAINTSDNIKYWRVYRETRSLIHCW